jgi:hypothetical protein
MKCSCARSTHPHGVQIRNLVEGKSYKFRLRCCFSSKEVSPTTVAASFPMRDDAVEPEHLHWSAFGPPSDDFKVRFSLAARSVLPLLASLSFAFATFFSVS